MDSKSLRENMDSKYLQEKLTSMMEAHFIAYKLREDTFDFAIDENDGSVYDAWDWNSPKCYSVIIKNITNRCSIKASINPLDREFILEVYNSHKDAGKFLVERYEELRPLKVFRSGWANCNEHGYHECLIYFEQEDTFFDLLEKYLKLL